jgi:hypothetical protein
MTRVISGTAKEYLYRDGIISSGSVLEHQNSGGGCLCILEVSGCGVNQDGSCDIFMPGSKLFKANGHLTMLGGLYFQIRVIQPV